MSKEETISGRQLFVLVFMTQLGTEVLSLPHAEAGIAGHDTWLAVLLSGLFAQAGIVLIWWVGSRYPSLNFFAYTSRIVGRPIGACLNLIYGCYYVLSGFLLTLSYSDILNRWMYILTPRWIITLMILIVGGYAAISTLKRIAFVSQSFMILAILGFLLIVFSGIYGFDIRNLLPVLTDGWYPVMKGTYTAFTAYVGYDLLLYAYPYVKTRSKKKVLLAMTLANACTAVYYIAVCLISTTTFGLKQLLVIPEPLVFILKNYRVEVLQSIDNLFLIVYACIVLATIYVYFYLAAKAFQHLRGSGLGKQQMWVWSIVVICFIGGFFIEKRSDIRQWAEIQDRLSVILVVALPCLLLMVSAMRGVTRSSL
ncbi:GerAB/ArcD/ProY family transporter [Paenibacillus montanisoli]|uniref:Spore gernimation protein n=1 Tax=Paenibacillus montanisoli TaxID=2081970 RepID=A0A328U4N7_9BACL|nr:GerAB/ArcD/ProY family transporter [Paenibacillus montanisoli]RAP75875.1 spore gernimation protein [Paenibacillus montanisoli]